MHTVAVVAFNGVDLFDFSTPCEMFRSVRLADGSAPYRVLVCATKPHVDAELFTIQAEHTLDGLVEADTVVIPGVDDPSRAAPPVLVEAVRAAAERGARVVSICTGAFVLAEAGLLDERRATTHWLDADDLAAWHPTVEVDADVLYVDHGRVVTAAGGAAALDVCLHLVRRDHGAAVAAELARCSVMPLEREGGQGQFIDHEPPTATGDSLEPVLRWAKEHLDADLSTQALAQRAATSPRTLARRFHEQVGTTPAQWVIGARIRRARELLESTDALISEVGEAVGYQSPSAFRARFGERVGVSPQVYRRNFQRSNPLSPSSYYNMPNSTGEPQSTMSGDSPGSGATSRGVSPAR